MALEILKKTGIGEAAHRRWRGAGGRRAGFGLLLTLPLALLVVPLPQSGANSQPIAPLARPAHRPVVELIAQRQPPAGTAARLQTAHTRAQPQKQPPRAAPLAQAKTEIVKFASAPFPYEGTVPGSDEPFLNVIKDKRKGHRTARGAVLWQDTVFNDSRVLLHMPSGFDINRPAVMVVYFHGHGAELSRDVLGRQNVPEQISASGVNAVLVAPQFAVDAHDSSAGRFWQPGGFARFLNEASKKLAKLYGPQVNAKRFANMPVIIVAYSGGYLPAAWSIRNGGLGTRLRGLVLLDALYGELGHFAAWIKNSRSAFFVSAYTSSTRRQNLELARILDEKNVRYSADIGDKLWRGRNVSLLPTGEDVNHQDFVTNAWTSNPIADILNKLN
ncbi:MAG: alpha/beta hydrolase [Rhizobiales bacterium]|nr:alpha/beta hydrolase [Hyphomicrobiales bacterium]